MADEPNAREIALATRVVSQRNTTARPRLSGSGPVFDTLNFIGERAPLTLVRLALVVFLAYVAWGYYIRAQQMFADVEGKDATATQTQVKADSVNKKVNDETAQLATVKAQLAKVR